METLSFMPEVPDKLRTKVYTSVVVIQSERAESGYIDMQAMLRCTETTGYQRNGVTSTGRDGVSS